MAKVTHTDYMPVVRINAPDWYKREDWMNAIRDPHAATWHDKDLKTPDEYSDLFTLYDCKEGNMTGIIPDDIWDEICAMVEEAMGTADCNCLLWIDNLELF